MLFSGCYCLISDKSLIDIGFLLFLKVFICFIDPHIKVSGKKENVKEAKEKIMSVLDTKVRQNLLSDLNPLIPLWNGSF